MVAKRRARVYKCKVCDYRCNQKEEEYEHKRQHLATEKTFACNACPFVTSFKHGLDYHEKSKHLKIKPYHCDKCEYDCVTKSMLKSHLKSHSPECEFVCTKCPYKTHHKHSLNQHVKQRHGSNEFDHIYSEVLSKQQEADSRGNEGSVANSTSNSLSRSSSRRSSTSSLSSGATTDTAIDPGSPIPYASSASTDHQASPKALPPTPGLSAPNPFFTPVQAQQLPPPPQIDHDKPAMVQPQPTVPRPIISPFQPLSLIPISAPPQVLPPQAPLQQAPGQPHFYTPMVPMYRLVSPNKPEPSGILDLRIESKLRP